jgi:cation transporter-like permease
MSSQGREQGQVEGLAEAIHHYRIMAILCGGWGVAMVASAVAILFGNVLRFAEVDNNIFLAVVVLELILIPVSVVLWIATYRALRISLALSRNLRDSRIHPDGGPPAP